MGKVETFIKELRESSDRMYNIFTQGSCVRLFCMLNVFYEDATMYWSDRDGHAITKIDGKYYDIGGRVAPKYVNIKEYHPVPSKHIDGYRLLKNTEEEVKLFVSVEKYFKD